MVGYFDQVDPQAIASDAASKRLQAAERERDYDERARQFATLRVPPLIDAFVAKASSVRRPLVHESDQMRWTARRVWKFAEFYDGTGFDRSIRGAFYVDSKSRLYIDKYDMGAKLAPADYSELFGPKGLGRHPNLEEQLPKLEEAASLQLVEMAKEPAQVPYWAAR